MSVDDTKSRLEAVRAQRVALEAARAAKAAELAPADELELEQRKLSDLEAITKAEAEHGPIGKKIAAVYTVLGVVIVKRPHHLLFKRFQDSGGTSSAEVEKLVRPHVVHPDAAAFERYLEEQPATLMRCADQIVLLAGLRAEEVQKKS